MTQRILLPFLLIGLLPAIALAEGNPAEEAVAAYQRGLELQARDPSAAREQFQAAVRGYQALIDAGHANAALFCNMGHACLLSGDMGRAVHYYRRAERLEPGNANVQAGLAQAGVLPKPPQTAGWPSLMLGVAAFALGWVLVLGAWRLRRRWLLLPAVPCVLGGLIVLGGVAWSGWQEERFPTGVIVEATTLREGNGANFQAVLAKELPAGAEFRTLLQREGWLRVELADGTRGWVPRGHVLTGVP